MQVGITEPEAVVIFGASGDLTKKKLIPALHSLNCEGLLNSKSCLIGVARSRLTEDAFREGLHQGVLEYARFKPNRDYICSLWPDFAKRIFYLCGDYQDPETYMRLSQFLESKKHSSRENCLFYLATPPDVFPIIIEQLGNSRLSQDENGWRRIIIEKPFGHDLDSARRLNAMIRACFVENQVFRIDHYLGKETVQNILSFRFANAIFEPIWSRNYIDHVQIIVAESDGVGQRGPYYDHAGVIRDMLQNHIMQLLTLTALEPPAVLNDRELRDEKMKVLQSIKMPEKGKIVLGQYGGYLKEPGISSDSFTPTFVAGKLSIMNWRWQGVPFYWMTGKCLNRRLTEISLQFKQVPLLLFPENTRMTRNHISFCIQPDEGIHLGFETKVPGAGMRTETVDMEFSYCKHFGDQSIPDAYERLLVDAIQGDASLFARADEIESAWSLIDPIIQEIERDAVRPMLYDPGTWGPAQADNFMARDDRVWHHSCGFPNDA